MRRVLSFMWLVASGAACSLLHPSSDYDDGSLSFVPGADAASPPGPSCTDRTKNGGETDVDCGGPCPKCALRLACTAPTDCESAVCEGGTCVAPFCVDGTKNREETATDCGGPECAPCDDGKACASARDCKSKRCNAGTCTVALSCMELKTAEPTLADGIYTIAPDPAGKGGLQTFCEMTTDGGGWTMIAHVNQDFVAAKLFEVDVGTFRADRSDADESYGRAASILRHLLHTRAMVTVDEATPKAKKVVFFDYPVGHPAFTNGPIPCQSLTNYKYRADVTGAFQLGTNDKCDALNWMASGIGALVRLSGAGATTKGLFWGIAMGGDNTWGHDGYWYVR